MIWDDPLYLDTRASVFCSKKCELIDCEDASDSLTVDFASPSNPDSIPPYRRLAKWTRHGLNLAIELRPKQTPSTQLPAHRFRECSWLS